jgi:lysophospholipase L1-like esterase
MIAGYKLRINGGALVDSVVDVGNVLTHDFTGLTAGVTYTVEVESYDDSTPPLESGYSDGVSATPADPVAVLAHTSVRDTTGSLPSITTPSIDSTGASALLVAVATYGGASGTVSDSKGNTWPAATVTKQAGSGPTIRWHVVKNPSSVGSGHTFTLTGGADAAIAAYAVSNTNSSSNPEGLDGHAWLATTVLPAGSIYPVADNEIIFAAVCGVKTSADIFGGLTIDEHQDFHSSVNVQLATAQVVQGSAANVSPVWHLGTAGDAAAAMISLRNAVGSDTTPPINSIIACVGDSRTEGIGVSLGESWPEVLRGTLGAGYSVYNLGISGDTIAGINSRGIFTTREATFYNGSAPRNILVQAAGINDLIGGSSTLQTDYAAYCATARAAGYLIIACTVSPGPSTNPSSFNTWLRGNFGTFADALCDIAADSRMATVSDATYFNPDQLHYSVTGEAVFAELVAPVVLSLV